MRKDLRAGFTLIEVLVAFVVLAVILVPLTRGIVSARIIGNASTNLVEAEAVARTLLEGPVPVAIQEPGKTEGVLDGYRWQMVSEALVLPLKAKTKDKNRRSGSGTWPNQPKAPPYRPLRVTIGVDAGNGRLVWVETVRIVRLGREPS